MQSSSLSQVSITSCVTVEEQKLIGVPGAWHVKPCSILVMSLPRQSSSIVESVPQSESDEQIMSNGLFVQKLSSVPGWLQMSRVLLSESSQSE